MKYVDKFLNSITMYKLVLYGLFILVAFSLIFSLLGKLSYQFSVLSLLVSFLALTISTYLSNLAFSKILKIPINVESSSITALILYFIMPPASSWEEALVLVLAGIIATSSKFLIAPFRKHIFNPAALAAFILYISGLSTAIWWVGDPVIAPFVLIFGLLAVRKIRRFSMVLSFAGAWLASLAIFVGSSVFTSLDSFRLALGNILFFATIMMTEPTTTPPTKKLQMAYGILDGLLINLNLRVANYALTPESVLMIGNAFSYIVSLKRRLLLSLQEKRESAKDVYEFVFVPDTKISFKPGQYLEWTLAHEKADNRGLRRYFTIASSPTENEIKLGVKYNEPPSSFKSKLFGFKTGDKIWAGQLGGDFVLPDDSRKKLAFLAGGIGVTPFRSMVKWLSDRGERRDIILLYSTKSDSEIAYRDLFSEAENKIGLKARYITGSLIDEDLLKKEIPDYKERIFYISGPEAMVRVFKKILLEMGVSRFRIRTDYFPGFA